MKVKFCLSLIFSLLIVSCTVESGYSKEVMAMFNKQVSIPYDNSCLIGTDSSFVMESIDCKLVVFTDSQSCASCAAKHLADWEYLLDTLETMNVEPVFIFDPPYIKRHDFRRELRHYVSFPVYVDTCHLFIQQNPFIPQVDKLQVFLLNGDNKICYVGNPLKSRQLQNLLFDAVVDNKNRCE